ncbi:MAG: PAS domain S-box protein, partial [Candidatus Hodarchaeota archaeon]
ICFSYLLNLILLHFIGFIFSLSEIKQFYYQLFQRKIFKFIVCLKNSMENIPSLESLIDRYDIPEDAKLLIKQSIKAQRVEQEEAEKYRELYKEVPIGLYRTTPEGQILSSNPYLIQMLGYNSLEDIQNINLEEREEGFHPSYPRSEFKERIEREGNIKGLEAAWQRKDGSYIFVRENAKIVNDDNGKVLFYEGSVEDITDKKKSEIELEKTRARLEYLLKSSPAVIFSCEPKDDYKTTFMSENIKDILGYDPEDFIGNPSFWEDRIYPDDREQAIKTFKNVAISGNYDYIYRYKHSDGEYRWMFEAGKIVRDSKGNPIEIIGYWTDITERRRAEEELQKTEEKYRTFFDQSLISTLEEDFSEVKKYLDTLKQRGVKNLREYFINNPEEIKLLVKFVKVLDVNKTTVKMYGAKSKEELLKGLNTVFGEDSYRTFQEEILALYEGQTIFEGEGINYSLQGEKIHCLLKIVIIPGYEKTWSKVIVSLIDISDMKQAEAARKELEKRRDNFVWMASHELRTPITVLRGYTDFFERHYSKLSLERVKKILTIMKNNIERLERLTADVTMISRIDKNVFNITKKKENLDEFLREAVDSYQHILGNQLYYHNLLEEVQIEFDKDRIRQVLDNILTNAIKHTNPVFRRIEIDVITQSAHVLINIKDNGAGIELENMERIFEQFVSIETEYSSSGTGIGLYLCREIVNAHNGLITVKSEGPGKGAIFSIQLPK